MSLPKWFFERNQDIYVKANRLERYFEIMWEALEKMEDVDEDDRFEARSYYKSWKLCQRMADEALRRIEEIGK